MRGLRASVTVALLQRCLVEVRQRWPDTVSVAQLIARIEAPCELAVVPFRSANGVRFADADSGLLEWIISRGAGGPDCVYSAERELERRGADVDKSVEDDEECDDSPF